MSSIMGIDQSFTSTGIVIQGHDGHLTYMTIETKKTDHPLEKFHRAIDISNQIVKLISDYDVTKVNIEGLAMGNIKGNANRDLASLQGVIVTHILEDTLAEVNVVTPTSLKKFATGKGNAKKEELFMALPPGVITEIEAYPKSRGRFDVTDAYWLCVYEGKIEESR